MILYEDDNYMVARYTYKYMDKAEHLKAWKKKRLDDNAIDWVNSKVIYNGRKDVDYIGTIPNKIKDIILKEKI